MSQNTEQPLAIILLFYTFKNHKRKGNSEGGDSQEREGHMKHQSIILQGLYKVLEELEVTEFFIIWIPWKSHFLTWF